MRMKPMHLQMIPTPALDEHNQADIASVYSDCAGPFPDAPCVSKITVTPDIVL